MRPPEILEAQARRVELFDDFYARQAIRRRWVVFVDLAVWAARSSTGASEEQEAAALNLAWSRLARSFSRGEFEQGGRSTVRYLDERVAADGSVADWHMTTERFKSALDGAAPGLPLYVLMRCWVPAEIGGRWLSRHGYQAAQHLLLRLRDEAPRPNVPAEKAAPDPAVACAPAGAKVRKALPPKAKGRPPTKREAAQQWVREHPNSTVSHGEAATAAGTSERTMKRVRGPIPAKVPK